MHVIQLYCKPFLLYLYASECFTLPVVRRGDATCTEKCSVHYSSCCWFVYTELSHGKLSRAHKLSFSSYSTNLVINGLYNFNTSELYCVFFVFALLCFVIHFIAILCLSVTQCLSVRLLLLWRIKIYILLHRRRFSRFKTIKPIQQLV